ncbi:DNA-binding protein [Streptomyces marincola]|uniref:DNA-binding protein n=2 Tax=Streptomyces marincola TaxID=2878388 RepID=A0A1W7D5H7_9ACTN|nr:helix-turn-helix domain-containing protein [Streptomyces marincola]ARQ72245.1 DNA-binding protein [Streptomyces marincola]
MPQSVDSTAERPQTFGARVRRARERAGMTRPVVGGLVGRSAEWVKAIECGRLGIPRLPLLLRLANVLGVDHIGDLTGDGAIEAVSYTKAAHHGLPAVRAALTTYRVRNTDGEPDSIGALLDRVRGAWRSWHSMGEHRTRVAAVLPDLLGDLQHAARAHEGADRRRALVALAETYHLAQLFLSFQPAPELVMLTGDRSMAAAQDADSPQAIAAAAWYMNHVFRDAGERHEARVDLAMAAADLLRPDSGPEDLARWGLLHLAAALSFAKIGRRGDAERFWDRADSAARRLGPDYAHPYLMFGRGIVDAYQVTMQADLVRGGAAVEAAGRVDLAAVPSATRRGFHLVETARAYSLQGEQVASVSLLKRAFEESPETVCFNTFARTSVTGWSESSNRLVRSDAESLRRRMRLSATA